MFAQLGNYIFENVNTFNTYSKKGAATYAEHSLLDSKPRLQKTGNALNELTVSMRFHVSFCIPRDQLKQLRTSRDNGEVLPLLWGNGTYEGDFVISDFSETLESTDPEGNIFSVVVSCNLKEYIVADKLQQKQDANRKQAKAVNKKPVAKKKKNPSQCPPLISRIVNQIDQHAQAMNVIVLQKGGISTLVNKNALYSHNAAIRLLCNDLYKRGKDPKSCAFPFPRIAEYAQLISAETQFYDAAITDNPPRIPTENGVLQTRVKTLKFEASPLIKQAITRK